MWHAMAVLTSHEQSPVYTTNHSSCPPLQPPCASSMACIACFLRAVSEPVTGHGSTSAARESRVRARGFPPRRSRLANSIHENENAPSG
jgi:hypothetical protein